MYSRLKMIFFCGEFVLQIFSLLMLELSLYIIKKNTANLLYFTLYDKNK